MFKKLVAAGVLSATLIAAPFQANATSFGNIFGGYFGGFNNWGHGQRNCRWEDHGQWQQVGHWENVGSWQRVGHWETNWVRRGWSWVQDRNWVYDWQWVVSRQWVVNWQWVSSQQWVCDDDGSGGPVSP